MARQKYKATGCARFLLVLLILIPLAYFGAKMIRGGEGIPEIDNFIESIFSPSEDKEEKETTVPDDKVEQMRKENEELKKRLEDLEKEKEN